MLYIYKNEGTNIIAIYIVTHILTVAYFHIHVYSYMCTNVLSIKIYMYALKMEISNPN